MKKILRNSVQSKCTHPNEIGRWGVHSSHVDSLLLFSGESVDDCGGGYSESIAEMCDELQNGSLPLLIVTPNGRDESGANRDCFLLNPMIRQNIHQNMFKFLGKD